MTEEKPKRKRGRPTKLTPELRDQMCLAIRTTKISLRDAAASLGIAEQTVHDWKARGDSARSGPYYDFASAIRQARADGTKVLLARIAAAGTEKKHWQANAHLLAITEPKYAPQVRVVVEKELAAAVERLTAAFRDEPAVLEKILAALGGGDDEDAEEEK